MKNQIAMILLLAACQQLSSDQLEKPDAGAQIGQTAEALGASEPLTWFRYGGDVVELQAALDCALPRWQAATCLPIDISYFPSHWVRMGIASEMAPGHVANSWGPWATAKTRVLEGMGPDWTCQTLVHEMSHILRRSNSHIGADGGISYEVIHLTSKITAADLDAVCAVKACGCYVPE